MYAVQTMRVIVLGLLNLVCPVLVLVGQIALANQLYRNFLVVIWCYVL